MDQYASDAVRISDVLASPAGGAVKESIKGGKATTPVSSCKLCTRVNISRLVSQQLWGHVAQTSRGGTNVPHDACLTLYVR